MTDNSHRERANASRAAAAESDLPNVRERNLRSAEASEVMADRQEKAAEKLKVRQAETAQRKASGIDTDNDDEDDGGEID